MTIVRPLGNNPVPIVEEPLTRLAVEELIREALLVYDSEKTNAFREDVEQALALTLVGGGDVVVTHEDNDNTVTVTYTTP